MPSIITSLLREQIRLLKPIFTNFSIKSSRALQEKLGELGSKAVAGKVEFTELDIGGIPAAIAVPVDVQPDDKRIVLYLHGGGYVAGSKKYSMGFAGVLAARANVRVMCAAYRLAPENPYPAALDDAVAVYYYLLGAGWKPENISLIGESAGGGLILALCMWLRDNGRTLPARIIPISPWTDLTLGGESYESNKKLDVSLTRREIEGFVEAYAPGKTTEPYVSPLLGDCAGLPPCRIYAGGDEILLSDSVMMAAKLTKAGVPCVLTVAEGLWHAYVLYGVPEANDAIDEISDFLCTKGQN